MNKSEIVYEQEQLVADLIGCECFGVDESVGLSEYDESIEEINAMLSWYVQEGNEEEIAFWRKMLQRTRVEKRRAKKMIDNMKPEVAYS